MARGQWKMLQVIRGEGEEIKFRTMLALVKLAQGRRWEERFTLLGRKCRIEPDPIKGEVKIAPVDN